MGRLLRVVVGMGGGRRGWLGGWGWGGVGFGCYESHPYRFGYFGLVGWCVGVRVR